MFSRWQIARKYLRYYLFASNGKGHGIHSPFVFDFVKNVLNDKREYFAYAVTEILRKKMLDDQRVLTVEDFGAGSGITSDNKRAVRSIAKHVTKAKKIGQLLFRMVKYYSPEIVIELGTSLGITSFYLAYGQPSSKFITLEGAREIAAVADENFEQVSNRPALIVGNFDETLSDVIESVPRIDFVFVDGNHRREPTERYFHQLMEKYHKGTVLVFDDIHWSHEMEEAWMTIRNDPRVRCSIDLFFIGIVFFRDEFHEKQHFTIRF
jgi:predicted O-methyltransferase YrrM